MTAGPGRGDAVETLHDGDWLRLRRRGRWEYAERSHGDGLAVVILAVTPDDEVLFVEQPRVPVGTATIEFPAGLVADIDSDEELHEAARRELVEETGWEAGGIETIVVGVTSPGMTNETIAMVRATDLRKVGPGGGDASEDITVHAIARDRAPVWLQRRGAEGLVLDLKLWTGLWLIDHDLDGTPRT